MEIYMYDIVLDLILGIAETNETRKLSYIFMVLEVHNVG